MTFHPSFDNQVAAGQVQKAKSRQNSTNANQSGGKIIPARANTDKNLIQQTSKVPSSGHKNIYFASNSGARK